MAADNVSSVQRWICDLQNGERHDFVQFCSTGYDDLRDVFLSHLLCTLVVFRANETTQDVRKASELLEVVLAACRCTKPSLTLQRLGQEIASGLYQQEITQDPEKLVDFLYSQVIKERPAHDLSIASAWDLTRELLGGSPRAYDCRLETPFVLIKGSGTGKEEAVIAQFVFERLPNGSGELFIAAEQAFVWMDDEFRRLFSDVPKAVRQLLRNEGKSFDDCDIRVRVQFWGGDKLVDDPLTGNSGSGAAARGLWYLLANKVPDREIIVLAQIDGTGSLSGVAGIETKVQEVAKAKDRFDTIIVASADNERDARSALRKLGKEGDIEVVNIEKPGPASGSAPKPWSPADGSHA
ncbi:MAG: hypothetical protein JXB46_11555 [Candidatus Eisenbacteria bacterium]|nr:hypothetical protein [Candidatus Eisenbacteria bacterium]